MDTKLISMIYHISNVTPLMSTLLVFFFLEKNQMF